MATWTRHSSASELTSNLTTRRASAVVGVLFAFSIVVLGSVDALTLPTWFVWVAGVAWLPGTVWLLLKEDNAPPAWLGGTRLMLNIVMMMATLYLVTDPDGVIGYLVIPLILSITYHRGMAVGAGVTLLALIARLGSPQESLTTDSSTRVVTATAVVILLIGVTGLIRQALERSAEQVKQVSSRSELITSYSTEGIIITDEDGRIVDVNPAARRVLFDDAPVDALIGRTCHDELSLVTESGAELDCTGGCALAPLCVGTTGSVELYQTTADGRRPLLGSSVTLPGQHGGTEILHSFRDISKVKEADEAKTMFLATASHELKTPLAVIRGFTQLLQARAEDPQDVMALDAIEARSLELSQIVDRLLLSSRIDAGRIDLELQPHDITALLRTRLEDAARSLGREVTLVTGEDVWAIVSDTALATIIDHLVDNAIKYSPDGGSVTVEVSTTDAHAIVRVVDEGIGMSAEQLEQCFDKFWQGEGTDVRRFGGTGIGLYIVQSLVVAMRGRISVESSRHVGTTFTILLPRVSAPPSDGEDRSDGDQAAEGRSAPKAAVDEFIQQLGIRIGGR